MGSRVHCAIPAAAIGMLMLSSSNVSANCTRHIYNKSACPWTFRAPETRAGNVWFDSITCTSAKGGKSKLVMRPRSKAVTGCNAENGPCLIAAGCIAEIRYTTSQGNIEGVFMASDQAGNSASWKYRLVAPWDSCPRTQHDGNTGAVAVNDPVDGDYTAYGCSW